MIMYHRTVNTAFIITGIITLAGALAGSASAAEVPAQEGSKPAATEYFGVYEELPLTDIKPDGWLRQWLVNQKNGLTGHPEVAGWPFNQKILFAEGEPFPPKENVGGGQHGQAFWWAEMLGTYARRPARDAVLL